MFCRTCRDIWGDKQTKTRFSWKTIQLCWDELRGWRWKRWIWVWHWMWVSNPMIPSVFDGRTPAKMLFYQKVVFNKRKKHSKSKIWLLICSVVFYKKFFCFSLLLQLQGKGWRRTTTGLGNARRKGDQRIIRGVEVFITHAEVLLVAIVLMKIRIESPPHQA